MVKCLLSHIIQSMLPESNCRNLLITGAHTLNEVVPTAQSPFFQISALIHHISVCVPRHFIISYQFHPRSTRCFCLDLMLSSRIIFITMFSTIHKSGIFLLQQHCCPINTILSSTQQQPQLLPVLVKPEQPRSTMQCNAMQCFIPRILLEQGLC